MKKAGCFWINFSCLVSVAWADNISSLDLNWLEVLDPVPGDPPGEALMPTPW